VFLLDTNPLLKRLIFVGQKGMWVNEMFEGRGKNGEFHMFSPCCWNNRASFMIVSVCCLKHSVHTE
jgi:hypothetical protein